MFLIKKIKNKKTKMVKNKMVKICATLVLLFVATLVVNVGAAKAGFGISPPYVKNDKVLKGTKFEQKVVISRDNPNETLKANVTVNVPDADKWISVDKGMEFSLPAGAKTVPIVVSVNVPENAPLKNYKGSITIATSTQNLKTGTVGIALGGELVVDFTVVEQEIKDFEINSIKTLDVRPGGRLTVLLNITNKGNVAVAPSNVVLDILDQEGNLIVSKTNDNNIEKIKPFSDGEVKAEFNVSELKPGGYWANLKTYNDSNLVNESKIYLSLLDIEKGGSAATGADGKSAGWLAKLGGDLWYIVGLILIVIAIAVVVMSKKKK